MFSFVPRRSSRCFRTGSRRGPTQTGADTVSALGTQQPPCQTKDCPIRDCFNYIICLTGSIDAGLGTGLGKKLLPGRGKLCRVGHHICRVARICRIAGTREPRPGRAPVPQNCSPSLCRPRDRPPGESIGRARLRSTAMPLKTRADIADSEYRSRIA